MTRPLLATRVMWLMEDRKGEWFTEDGIRDRIGTPAETQNISDVLRSMVKKGKLRQTRVCGAVQSVYTLPR